jgi:hypothetical protein
MGWSAMSPLLSTPPVWGQYRDRAVEPSPAAAITCGLRNFGGRMVAHLRAVGWAWPLKECRGVEPVEEPVCVSVRT